MASANYILQHVSDNSTPEHSDLNNSVWCCIWTSKFVLVGTAGGQLQFWSLDDTSAPVDDVVSAAEPVLTDTWQTSDSTSKPQAITAISVARNETFVVVASLSGRITRLSINEESLGREQAYFDVKNTPWAVSAHPTQPVFALGGEAGNVTIRNSSQANFGDIETMLQIGDKEAQVTSCRYSPNGNLLACSTDQGVIKIYETTNYSEVQQLKNFLQKRIRTLAFSPDSALLLVGADDSRLSIYDVKGLGDIIPGFAGALRQGEGLVASVEHDGFVVAVSVRSDGKYFVTGTSKGTIKIFETAKPTVPLFTTKDHDYWIGALTWKPLPAPATKMIEGIPKGSISAHFVSGSRDGQLHWWRSTG